MIVYIEWEDAWTHKGWVDKDNVDEATMLIKTIGFLVSEDKKMVRVAFAHSDDNNGYEYITSIPRVNIKKYLEISVKGLAE